MEGVAAASSILQLVGFALKGIENLHDFFTAIRDAPAEIRTIKADTGALYSTLRLVRHSCLECGTICDIYAEALSEALTSCGQNLLDLLKLLGRFVHEGTWDSAFVWRWKRSEIQRLRKNIAESKLTLSLSLSTVQIEVVEAGNQRLSRKIDMAIRSRNQTISHRATVDSCLRFEERVDGKVELEAWTREGRKGKEQWEGSSENR